MLVSHSDVLLEEVLAVISVPMFLFGLFVIIRNAKAPQGPLRAFPVQERPIGE